eukprot:3937887-Rhodomonas_salina.2
MCGTETGFGLEAPHVGIGVQRRVVLKRAAMSSTHMVYAAWCGGVCGAQMSCTDIACAARYFLFCFSCSGYRLWCCTFDVGVGVVVFAVLGRAEHAAEREVWWIAACNIHLGVSPDARRYKTD